MKTINSSIIFFFAFVCKNFAQYSVETNPYIDTIDVGNKLIINIFREYYNTVFSDTIDFKNWNLIDKAEYASPDLLLSNGIYNPNIYKIGYPYIMSISEMGQDKMLKVLFYYYDSKTKQSFFPWAIVNYYFIEGDDGSYSIANYQRFLTKSWNFLNVGYFDYYFYPEFPFDKRKAEEANVFLEKLIYWFKIPKPKTKIKYFIAKNCSEIQQLRGFEYVMTNSHRLNFCGYYDDKNNIVFSNAIKGEFFEHEIIHYLNQFFPLANPLLLMGISAYLNEDGRGHLNETLNYHVEKINNYLKLNIKIDLNQPQLFYKIDGLTNPQYITGAIICHEIIKRKGVEGLIEVLRNSKEDIDMIAKLNTMLNIKNKNFNIYLRQKYDYYSKNKITPILQ
ncbi:MAG: hypothetical protein QM642_08230 [Edaphocola sp.]